MTKYTQCSDTKDASLGIHGTNLQLIITHTDKTKTIWFLINNEQN